MHSVAARDRQSQGAVRFAVRSAHPHHSAGFGEKHAEPVRPRQKLYASGRLPTVLLKQQGQVCGCQRNGGTGRQPRAKREHY